MKLLTSGFEWSDCKYIFDPKTIVRNQQWTVEIKIRPTIEIKTRPELDEPTKTAFALFDVEIVWKCDIEKVCKVKIKMRPQKCSQNWGNCIPHTAGWKTEQRSPEGRLVNLPVTNLNIQQPKTQITFEVSKLIGCCPQCQLQYNFSCIYYSQTFKNSQHFYIFALKWMITTATIQSNEFVLFL